MVKLYSQRYAWARAADAGAVSAFRTASSKVEATNRTLCTYGGEENVGQSQNRLRHIRSGIVATHQRGSVRSDGLDRDAADGHGHGRSEHRTAPRPCAPDTTHLCRMLRRSRATASRSLARWYSSMLPWRDATSSSRYCSITKRTNCWAKCA